MKGYIVSADFNPSLCWAMTYLVLSSGLLSQCLNSRNADSQVEATNVVDLGVFDLLPDVVLLQVLKLVVVGGSKICAERAVVASDDDTAAAGGGLLVVEVLGLDTSLLADVLKSLAVLVLANAANVEDGLGGQDVLGTTGGVLRSTTGNEDGLVVLDQVLVETHVLLRFGKDRVVGLEAVLLEELLITALRSEKFHKGAQPRTKSMVVHRELQLTYPTPWMSRRGFSRQSNS